MNLPHTGTDSAPKTIAVTSDIPDTSKMVTTDTEQTITGKKVFGTLQATSLTDGTTTKTMTEVLAGGGGGAPVDEKTIITNEDGTISTALGGYVENVEIQERTFSATRSYKSGE